MSRFKSKFLDRKIAPGFSSQESDLQLSKNLKPHFFEEKINFDRLRLYRLNRVRDQLTLNNIGACILFDPINIRYATDTRNMSLFTMHNKSRYVFIPQDGPVILFDYPKSEHLSEGMITIDEIRETETWDFFSSGNNYEKQAKVWADSISSLVKKYSPDNFNLAIDVSEPIGIQYLSNQFGLNISNAQNLLELARVIKSEDEIWCMKAAIKVAELGMFAMKENLTAGMTEEEIWSFLHKVNIEKGGEWFETRLLNSGPRTNPWLQECSNRVIERGDLVAFDTDMIGPYGYCADISRTFVEGGIFSEAQKDLYKLAKENIDFNKDLIQPGLSFFEFAEKAWKLPEKYFNNHYPCIIHGIGMCDEWPFVKYHKNNLNQNSKEIFKENMTICIETYIGEVGGIEGVKLEDQFLITNSGIKQLSKFPLELL